MKKPSLAKAARSAAAAGQLSPLEQRRKNRTADAAAVVLPIEKIEPDKDQPRKFFAGLNTLAESLKAHGQLQAIVVWFDPLRQVYRIIAGERRYRAAKMAGLTSLKAFVWNEDGRSNEGDRLELMLVENAHRADVLPLEHAAGIRRLMEIKRINASQAAERLKLHKGTVTKLIALLDLDARIRNHVDNGELSASAAYEISKLPDVKDQLALADRAVKTKLSRDEVSRLVLAKKAGTWPPHSPVTPSETPRETEQAPAVRDPDPVARDDRAESAESGPRARAAKQPSPVVSERANTGPLKDTDYYLSNGWHVLLTSERSAQSHAIARVFRRVAEQIEDGTLLGSVRVRPDEPKFDFCSLHKPRSKRPA